MKRSLFLSLSRLLPGLALLPSGAWASDLVVNPTVATTSVELATGGSSRANPDAFGNVLLSPAVLALVPRYEVRADGLVAVGDTNAWSAQASAVDSRTGPVTLGASYRWTRDPDLALRSEELPGWHVKGRSRENMSQAHAVALGVATADSRSRWAAGLSAARWWRTASIAGEGEGWRIGGSLAARPHELLVFSLGGGLPIATQEARGAEAAGWLDTAFRVGASRSAALHVDLHFEPPEFGTSDLSGGGEWVLSELLALRAGALREGEDGGWSVTGGLGIENAEASIDYGLLVGLDGSSATDTDHRALHQLSLRVSF
jgi:hypothetical protein